MAKKRKNLPVPPRVTTLGDLVEADDFGFESCPVLTVRSGQNVSLVRLSAENLGLSACFVRALERDDTYAVSIVASDAKQVLGIRPIRKEQYMELTPDALQRDNYVILPGTNSRDKTKQIRITGLIAAKPWLRAQIQQAGKHDGLRYPRWKRSLGLYVLETNPTDAG